jgi:ADP-ribose diphosphatase
VDPILSRTQGSSQLIFSGRIFSVRRHTAIEPGGLRTTREIVHHPGSAVILPQFSDGRILLIRQYRLAIRRRIWELPAGTIDKGETAFQTARRELGEETGYTSKSWRKLLEYFPSPGFIDEKMTLFLASDIRPGPPHMEEDERIRTRAFSMVQLLRMMEKKKIVDAKSLVGLLFFERWGSDRLRP